MRISQDLIIKQAKSHRQLTFVGLIVFNIILGALDITFNYVNGFRAISFFAGAFIMAGLIVLWCKFDSKSRNARLKTTDAQLIFLFGMIGIPKYFWETRSRQKFLLAIGGLYLYIVPVIAYYISWFITGEILQRIGYYS